MLTEKSVSEVYCLMTEKHIQKKFFSTTVERKMIMMKGVN